MLGFDSAEVKFAKAQLSNDKENRMMDADVRVIMISGHANI
jgi:hypothetical protein